MGATAAIGAGISVVGGIASHNQKNRQARAERAAIDSQNKINQLNSQLQLMELENQDILAKRQNLLQQAVDDEAYLNRQFQLNMGQLQNQTALTQAQIDARLGQIQAGVNQTAGEQQALDQRTNADSAVTQALAQTIGVSGQEVQQLANAFSQMPEKERQRSISAIMDLNAMEDGENLALQLLTELEDNGDVGNVNQAIGLNQARVANADAVADASRAENAQRQALGNNAAALQGEELRYQADTSLLDANTAERTNAAADASERIALDSQYRSNTVNRELQEQMRSVSSAANRDVLEQGSVLSEQAMDAQRASVSGSGFFDLLSIGGRATNTYTSLGGDFGFLNKRTNSNGVLTDVTNVSGNIG